MSSGATTDAVSLTVKDKFAQDQGTGRSPVIQDMWTQQGWPNLLHSPRPRHI